MAKLGKVTGSTSKGLSKEAIIAKLNKTGNSGGAGHVVDKANTLVVRRKSSRILDKAIRDQFEGNYVAWNYNTKSGNLEIVLVPKAIMVAELRTAGSPEVIEYEGKFGIITKENSMPGVGSTIANGKFNTGKYFDTIVALTDMDASAKGTEFTLVETTNEFKYKDGYVLDTTGNILLKQVEITNKAGEKEIQNRRTTKYATATLKAWTLVPTGVVVEDEVETDEVEVNA